MRINKSHNVFLTILPLATVAILGVPSINTRVYAQKASSTITPNNIPAANQKNQQLTQENIKGTASNAGSDLIQSKNPPETEADKYQTKLADFQKEFLNTVFLSLLGTAISIALAIIALQFFANIFVREQDKREVKEELKKIIKIDLEKMEQRLLNAIEQKVYSTEIKLRWLEYQTVVLSAENLEQNEIKFERGADILQERIRAIRVLDKIESDSLTGVVRECMQQELENIEVLLERLIIIEKLSKAKIYNHYPNLRKQIPQYNDVLKKISERYPNETKKTIEYIAGLS